MGVQLTIFSIPQPLPPVAPPVQLTVAHNRHEGNQEILDENRAHYKNQTEIVLQHLDKGEGVTGDRMYRLHGIQDFRPRIAAIRKIRKLRFEKIEGGHGAKEWWIEKD